MDYETIQNFADENNLDLRELCQTQYRLINKFDKYILDIYIKHKKGVIIKNTTMRWSDRTWHISHTKQDLNMLLTNS